MRKKLSYRGEKHYPSEDGCHPSLSAVWERSRLICFGWSATCLEREIHREKKRRLREEEEGGGGLKRRRGKREEQTVRKRGGKTQRQMREETEK